MGEVIVAQGAGSCVCWTRVNFMQRRRLWADFLQTPNGWTRSSVKKKVQKRGGRDV